MRTRILRGAVTLAVMMTLGLPVALAEWGVQGGEVGTSPFKTLWVSADTASAGDFNAGSLIYGFKLVGTTATAGCDLYDAATLGAATEANVIDELRVNTIDTTQAQIWPTPYKLTTDLTIDVTDGSCGIYYR